MIWACGQVRVAAHHAHQPLAQQEEVELVGELRAACDSRCCALIHSVTAGPYFRQKRLR